MIKVSVMYPSGKDAKFDIGYYTGTHMPLVQARLGAALKKIAVEEGLAGGAPGAPPPYAAFGHLYFDSVEAFQAAFGPHANEIMGDLPNFTNIQPTIQISAVKL
ncbi:MAG: ethyl tert-butyl ether degradation protein EthD [Hydrocarboniphaga sp.]|uniref:EthD family reductase n=1 Tax=Hydrocarboniphaga sp. TaxID=2033016 RepID=UPI002627DA06|nr:EthD family reductase [Hydrocarboniphaga sp.]MDB5969245.1 ethyl tert-butyl ether degradation protein EthD [Hydrocarboniphaga sp.]